MQRRGEGGGNGASKSVGLVVLGLAVVCVLGREMGRGARFAPNLVQNPYQMILFPLIRTG